MSEIHLVMLVAGLLIGIGAGFVMHRADYCVAGMFRDLFLFRTTRMLKSLILLVAFSMLLFEIIRLSGWVAVPFPFFGSPSLINLFGGMLFGIGMVLAGGCVVGSLYKLGSGSLPGLLAFVGLLVGSVLYALLHPVWVLFSKQFALPTRAVTLPQLLHVPPWLLVLPLSCLLLLVVWRWYKQGKLSDPLVVEGYLQPWQAALVLALLGAAAVAVLGMPMGITTSYAKFGATLLQPLAPDFYATIAYFKLMPVSYTPPLGGVPLTGGPGPQLDAVALVQYPLIFGIMLGAAFSAFRLGEWRVSGRLPLRQAVSAVAGGLIMGLASRMAPACNIWHLFGGLPILALQSVLFVIGLLPGAWLGGLLLTRVVIPQKDC